MSGAPRYRARALADIEAIWLHSAQRWGEAQAHRYVLAIRDTCNALAAGALTGRDASAVRPGYRRQAVGRHIVFFRTGSGAGLEVVRVLHERMDLPARLAERG